MHLGNIDIFRDLKQMRAEVESFYIACVSILSGLRKNVESILAKLGGGAQGVFDDESHPVVFEGEAANNSSAILAMLDYMMACSDVLAVQDEVGFREAPGFAPLLINFSKLHHHQKGSGKAVVACSSTMFDTCAAPAKLTERFNMIILELGDKVYDQHAQVFVQAAHVICRVGVFLGLRLCGLGVH